MTHINDWSSEFRKFLYSKILNKDNPINLLFLQPSDYTPVSILTFILTKDILYTTTTQ